MTITFIPYSRGRRRMRVVPALLVACLCLLGSAQSLGTTEMPVAPPTSLSALAAAVPLDGHLPPWAVGPNDTPDLTGMSATRSAAPLPLVPGFDARVERIGDCPLACAEVLVVPANGGTSADDTSASTFDRSPYPAGDVDGDGVEDLHLVGFIWEVEQEHTSVLTLSGANGSLLRVLEFDADWVGPRGMVETDQGPLEIFWVHEDRQIVQADGYDVHLWSRTAYAYRAGTADLVWRVAAPADLRPDGSGRFAVDSLSWAGDYLGNGTQVLRTQGNYTWTDDFVQGDFERTLTLVDPWDLSLHYRLDETAWPIGYWDTPEGRDFFGRENGTVSRRDGRDNSLLWSGASPGFPVDAVGTVTVEGEELLLARGFDAETTRMGVIGLDGETRWARSYSDLPRWMYAVGVHHETDSSRLHYASLDFACPTAAVPYRLGAIDARDGAIVWEVRGDAVGMGVFSLAAGDHDGDGVGDPAIVRRDIEYDAVFSSESCHGSSGFILLSYRTWTRVEVISSSSGRVALDTGEMAGLSLPVLSYWAPQNRFVQVASIRAERDEFLGQATRRILMDIYHPQVDRISQHVLDEYVLDRDAQRSSGFLWGLPLRPFGGPVDIVYAFDWTWQEVAGPLDEPETRSRSAVFVHDVATGRPLWQFAAGAPSADPLV